MSDNENDQKIIQAIANATFQSLNIQGLVHAAKFYCVHEARGKFPDLDEETKAKILQEIEEQEKEGEKDPSAVEA
jgi:hypothetical protein